MSIRIEIDGVSESTEEGANLVDVAAEHGSLRGLRPMQR